MPLPPPMLTQVACAWRWPVRYMLLVTGVLYSWWRLHAASRPQREMRQQLLQLAMEVKVGAMAGRR